MQHSVVKARLTENSFIYSFINENGRLCHLHSKQALKLLRHYVSQTDYNAIRLDITRIGLHSLRAAAAMAMFLNHVPTETIKIIGRWASEAFLRYIQPMIEQFNLNVSYLMTQNPVHHRIRPPTQPPRTNNGTHEPLNEALSPWTNLPSAP